MRINCKGMTLLELLISIILVGIVLTFLFQLLIDLKGETTNNNYVYNNQLNRTEAIYTIQKDLNKYTLLGLKDSSVENSIAIEFDYIHAGETVTAVLTTDTVSATDEIGENVTKYYLRYKSADGQNYSWEMKGAEIDTCGLFTYYVDTVSNNYYFKLNIYLYNNIYHERNNKEINNAVDDIEITYAGSRADLIMTNGDYLTGNKELEKKIGSCTN